MHVNYYWYRFGGRLSCNDCDECWYFDLSGVDKEELNQLLHKVARQHAMETIPVRIDGQNNTTPDDPEFW